MQPIKPLPTLTLTLIPPKLMQAFGFTAGVSESGTEPAVLAFSTHLMVSFPLTVR